MPAMNNPSPRENRFRRWRFDLIQYGCQHMEGITALMCHSKRLARLNQLNYLAETTSFSGTSTKSGLKSLDSDQVELFGNSQSSSAEHPPLLSLPCCALRRWQQKTKHTYTGPCKSKV